MGPHAREAVGLQLDPHLQLIAVDLVHALLQLLYLGQDTEQVLHVMPDLVGNHVGFRELARLAAGIAGAKPPLQVLKEGRIEINLAIVRTVEWPHSGLCEAAARSCYAGKHNESRRLIGLAGLRKDLLPLRFGAAEHGGYELRHLVRGGARASLLRLLLLLRTASARENVDSAD